MSVLRGERGQLELGGVDLGELMRGGAIGTPAYVYDLTAMAREATLLAGAFEGEPHLIAYAIKANSAGPVVRSLRAAGCGADVVSGAELSLAMACGVPPEAILFSGVGKLDREIDAAVNAGHDGIGAIQIESVEEIARVSARARAMGRRARISLRLNPEASLETLDTHAHIATGHDEAKFGIARGDFAAALTLVTASPNLVLAGLSAHAGSQFTSTKAYLASARTLFEVASEVRRSHGAALRFVDTGGGFGIDYGEGCPVTPADFVRETRALKSSFDLADLALHVEPGRALVAAHGVLLATVIQHKSTPYEPTLGTAAATRRWLMIDAGMNDLLRPALYQARHRIEALEAPLVPAVAGVPFRVVGPVCESSDDFGVHLFPAEPPHAVAILDAGAYGYTMASRYNGRPLPAEVFIEGGCVVASRVRDTETEWVRDRYDLGLSEPALSERARS